MEIDKEEIKNLYSLIARLQHQIYVSEIESKNYINSLNYVPQFKVPFMVGAKIHYMCDRRRGLKSLFQETEEVLKDLKNKYGLE